MKINFDLLFKNWGITTYFGIFSKLSFFVMLPVLNAKSGPQPGGAGGRSPPEKNCCPPSKKEVTIIHDTGIGNLAPLKYFSSS